MACDCVSEGCNCVVIHEPTGCSRVAGTGTAGDPFVVDTLVDPSALNLLSCQPTGLLATIDAQAGSTCLSVSGSGTSGDPLIIDVVLDPDVTNTLECRANGLYVNVPVVDVDLACAFRRSWMGV